MSFSSLDIKPRILSQAEIQALIDASIGDFLDTTEVQALIDASIGDFLDTTEVQALIDASVVDFLDATEVQALIDASVVDFLDATEVQALIDAALAGFSAGMDWNGKIWVDGTSYTTAQEAYDAAEALQVSIGGTNIVVMEVGIDSDGLFDFFYPSGAWNQYVHIKGLGRDISTLPGTGAGGAMTIHASDITFTSEIDVSGGALTVVGNNAYFGLLSTSGTNITVSGYDIIIDSIESGGGNINVSGTNVEITGNVMSENGNGGDITIGNGVHTGELTSYGSVSGGNIVVGDDCVIDGTLYSYSDGVSGNVTVGKRVRFAAIDASTPTAGSSGTVSVGDGSVGAAITTESTAGVGGAVTLGVGCKVTTINTQGVATGGAVVLGTKSECTTISTVGATTCGNVTLGNDAVATTITMGGAVTNGGILSIGDRVLTGAIDGSASTLSKAVTIGDDCRLGALTFTAATHSTWSIGDRNEIGAILAEGDRTGGAGTSTFTIGDGNKVAGIDFRADDGSLSTFTMGDYNEITGAIYHFALEGSTQGLTIGHHNIVTGEVNNSRDTGTSPMVIGNHNTLSTIYNRVFVGGSGTGVGQPVTIGRYCTTGSILNFGSDTTGGSVTVGMGSAVGAIETWCEDLSGVGGDITLNHATCGPITMTDAGGNTTPGLIYAVHTKFQNTFVLDSLHGSSIFRYCSFDGHIAEVFSNGAQFIHCEIVPAGATAAITASAAKTIVVQTDLLVKNAVHVNVTASEGTITVSANLSQIPDMS